jgi:hypothetical protein
VGGHVVYMKNKGYKSDSGLYNAVTCAHVLTYM